MHALLDDKLYPLRKAALLDALTQYFAAQDYLKIKIFHNDSDYVVVPTGWKLLSGGASSVFFSDKIRRGRLK